MLSADVNFCMQLCSYGGIWSSKFTPTNFEQTSLKKKYFYLVSINSQLRLFKELDKTLYFIKKKKILVLLILMYTLSPVNKLIHFKI